MDFKEFMDRVVGPAIGSAVLLAMLGFLFWGSTQPCSVLSERNRAQFHCKPGWAMLEVPLRFRVQRILNEVRIGEATMSTKQSITQLQAFGRPKQQVFHSGMKIGADDQVG